MDRDRLAQAIEGFRRAMEAVGRAVVEALRALVKAAEAIGRELAYARRETRRRLARRIETRRLGDPRRFARTEARVYPPRIR